MTVDLYGDPSDEESPQLKEVRDHAKALEKQLREQSKELEASKQALAEAQTSTRVSAATSLGLSERQAKSFLKDLPDDGEVSKETIAAWRVEMGYEAPAAPAQEPAAAEGQEPAPQHLGSTGFAPASAGGAAPDNQLTYEEYRTLLANDFNAAARAVAENRVTGLYKPPE